MTAEKTIDETEPEISPNDDRRFLARVHEALEAASGNREAAAQALGISMQTLKNRIYECPNLRRRWASDEALPPDEIETISRDAIKTDEERVALEIERAGKQFRRDFTNLPLSEAEVEMALALQQFNRKRFSEILDMTNASMGVAVIKIMKQLTHKEERLNQITSAILRLGDAQTEERMSMVQEEESVSKQFVAFTSELIKAQKSAFAGSQTLALIKYRLAGKSQQKKAKPGFQDIDV